MADLQQIPIGKIKVGDYDIRMEENLDAFDGLRSSIRRIGIIVPLLVSGGPDSFSLIAGHRRYRAAVLENFKTVPAIVTHQDGAARVETSFAENLFRQDLTALELAAALNDVLKEGTMTVEQLARAVGHSKQWVRGHVAILAWPQDVQISLQTSKLSVAAASNLAMVEDDGYRGFLLRNAVEQGATARVTAAWLQAWRAMQPAEQAITAEPAPGEQRSQPMVPQAPCLVCSEVFRTDELSHVPICASCIRSIRNAVQPG